MRDDRVRRSAGLIGVLFALSSVVFAQEEQVGPPEKPPADSEDAFIGPPPPPSPEADEEATNQRSEPPPPAAVEDAEDTADRLREAFRSASGWIADMVESVTPYASLRVRFLWTSGSTEVQNGASRIGAHLRREFAPGIAATGQLEWQVNLVNDPTILTAGDSTSSDLQSTDGDDALENRLGWLGVDFGKWGELRFGKQWSPYYDVAGWTDLFYVFGGSALGVYNAGTDGGVGGTGRSEQAIVWRGQLGERVRLAAQYRAPGIAEQDPEALGGSVRFRAADWITLGASYNIAKLGDEATGIAFDDDPRNIAAGVRIDWRKLTARLVYADQRQSEVGTVGMTPTLFDSIGYELYAHYDLTDRFGVYGGGNWRDSEDSILNRNRDIADYYIGLDWRPVDRTLFYVQGRFAGEQGDDALVIGHRWEF